MIIIIVVTTTVASTAPTTALPSLPPTTMLICSIKFITQIMLASVNTNIASTVCNQVIVYMF